MTFRPTIVKAMNYWRQHRWIDHVLLCAFVLALITINIIWINAESRPPHWDMARHLWTSLQYYDLFKQFDVSSLLTAYFYYPPFLYWVAAPFYLIFRESVTSAVLSNVVFISIAAFATYGTGRTLWGRRAGLLASVFLLASPMMVSQFKEFQVDAPLTAIVCLVLYVIVKTRDFASTWYSIALGGVLGAGMLTKWTFSFVVAAPMITLLAIALYKSWREKSWQRVINIMLCLLIAYAVASIWYLPNNHQLLIDLTKNGISAGIREGDPVVGSFTSNIWYVWNLISNQLYLLPFVSVLTGLAFLVHKDSIKKNRYPLALVLGTLLIFTMLRNKDARYTLPALAGLGIIGTYWISLLKSKFIKNLISVIVVLYSIAMLLIISNGSKLIASAYTLDTQPLPFTLYASKGYIIGGPTHEDWELKHVMEISNNKKVYYTGPDTIWFNSWALAYYAKLYGAKLVTNPAEADAILIRTEPGESYRNVPDQHIIERYQLPDKGELIYAHRN